VSKFDTIMNTMNNDDAVEAWKETRSPRHSTAGWMTRDERAADDWFRKIGVCQAVRDALRAREARP